MTTRKHLPVYQLTLGALYIAIFALAGNMPFLSLYLIPNVPITLQTFLIAMMGLTLGFRGGMVTYISLLLLTLCGLPMMSGGKGGPAALFGPTGGYIIGWVFLILLLGLYSTLYIDRLVNKKVLGISIHLPVSFVLGMTGILLDYICGTLGLIVFYAEKSMADFAKVFAVNSAFLLGDAVKIGLASLFSLLLFAKPALRRLFNIKTVG